MMPLPSPTPALLAALLLALAGPGARAAGTSSAQPTAAARTAARKAFEQGVALYQQARYAEAAAAFEAAAAAVPNGVVHYNLGQCYERLGQLERAIAAYREYLRTTPRAEDRRTVEALVTNLEARWEEERRPRVSVRSEPEGARVTVDGTLRGQTPWAGALEPGPHTLEVAHAGHLPVQRRLEVKAGEPLQLELVLSPLAPAPAPAVARPPGPRVWTWVALGAAGAAAAGGLTYGLLARNDARTLLGSAHERAEADALRTSALTRAHTANVLYGVAGAAALAGGVLFFVEGSF